MKMAAVQTAVQSPWQNGVAEHLAHARSLDDRKKNFGEHTFPGTI
jgi:hypothetical protein